MTALELQRVSKFFGGNHAVEQVSFAISRGTITSLIGPNGSGKSTIVNLLSGMLPPTAGSIAVHGQRVRLPLHPSDVPRYGMTRTFQDVRVFEQMSVLDNILVVLTRRNVWGSFVDHLLHVPMQRAEEVLRKVGLWEKRRELASRCSYGQRKLLEIARALAMDVDVYLFDEPFAGLFPEMMKIVVAIMQELKQRGKTIILIEHNMSLIRLLSDRVIVLDAGKVLAEGTPDAVLKRAEVIEAYLGV